MQLSATGVYPRISEEDYHNDPAPAPSLSRSILYQLIFRSPAHAWQEHPRLNPGRPPRDESKFDLGAAAHDALLCGMERVQPLDFPDWRTKAARDARAAVRATSKLPVLVRQYDAINAMVEAAQAFWSASPDLAGYPFARGITECTALWKEADDTWCRARFDWLAEDRTLILDYKSTLGSANPEQWARAHVVSDGLDIQAAWYTRANQMTSKAGEASFVFLVQECAPPYACALVGLNGEYLQMGEEKCARGLTRWQSCLRSEKWPAYHDRVHWLTPPAYAAMQWQEMKEEEMA